MNAIETLIKDIEVLTDRNDHTGALLRLAQFSNNDFFVKLMQQIKVTHDLEGHLPNGIYEYRKDVKQRLFLYLSHHFNEADILSIKKAF